jgi:hypothetical protein
VRKLLQDVEPAVRLRAARALAAAGDREAVPVLIDLLAVLPADQAGLAQEALYQLAGDKAPEAPAGADAASGTKRRDAWAAWWKGHGDKVEMARLDPSRALLGYTLLVEVGNNNVGRVVELGRDNKPRWIVDSLQFPVDAVVLPGNRVLVAEYGGQKVTERDFKGNILWQKEGLNGTAVNVQRLPNGHTFIATNAQLLEVDRAGKEVFAVNNLGGIDAAYKARNGHVICLTNAGQCVRLDARGHLLKSFPSNRSGFTSGLDLLPGGRILITQPNHNKVAEVDAEGKVVLTFDAPQVTTATALPNGHILVGSMNTQRAFEVDRKGKVVWEYKDGYRVFRARRR